MPNQKLPWRTLVKSEGDRAGRFTRAQIRQAILEVMAMEEAEARRARKIRRNAAKADARRV